METVMVCRKLASTKSTDHNSLKCAVDHILDAQQKGEINEDNVLYIVENINVAGISPFPLTCVLRVRNRLVSFSIMEND